MEVVRRLQSYGGAGQLAQNQGQETKRVCEILAELRGIQLRRIISAWRRSPETFWEEVVTLNDIDEAIRNNCV